jgi:dTDP-4-dehydrorhamnose reductase
VPFLCRGLSGEGVRAVCDQTCCATWAGDLAPAIAGLLEREVSGVVHMANTGARTPAEIARMLRPFCGGGEVEEISWRDLDLDAPRPRWSVLGSERGFMLRPLAAALEEWRERNEIG